MKVCIDKGTNDGGCCKAWTKGIRTINNQYPDDNREFGILEGTGIVITPETAGIRITCTVPSASTLTAGDNIDISPGGNNEIVVSLVSDPIINGDIQINGDIIQNGSAYETHAEKIYTTNDYIITRDGAISALSAGDYSGFQVKKYDGTNDGRLVIDNTGTARVGDVGDEQPLLTRDESNDLTNGESLVWDAINQKAVTETIPSAISTALNGKQPINETVVVNSMAGTINIAYIGTKLANCKYAILKWHDTRNTDYHTATVIAGQSGGCSTGFAMANYEFEHSNTVYYIGISIQNYSTNVIVLSAQAIKNTDASWGSHGTYNTYMYIEDITFVY